MLPKRKFHQLCIFAGGKITKWFLQHSRFENTEKVIVTHVDSPSCNITFLQCNPIGWFSLKEIHTGVVRACSWILVYRETREKRVSQKTVPNWSYSLQKHEDIGLWDENDRGRLTYRLICVYESNKFIMTSVFSLLEKRSLDDSINYA